MSSGLMSQLGAKKEATYGTRVVPDHFIEFESESFSLDQRYFVSQQLGAGSTFARGSRRIATTRSGEGAITMEVPNKGYGFWLDLLHDNVVTPVQQAATAAYLQTHNIGLTAPSKSATIQVGKPSTDGTVRPFDYLGCMITEAEWAWDVDDALKTTLTFDAQDEKTDQTLATRTLPSGLASFVFTQGSLSIAGGVVGDVTSGSITLGLPRQTDFYPLGTTGLKSKPLQNEISSGSGTATVRFTDLVHYNRYKNNTKPTLELLFEGPIIASTYKETFKLRAEQVGFTGETPTVGGPDVLQHDIPFDVFYDGSAAPLVASYISTDVTL
jgi:hypothetical protein